LHIPFFIDQKDQEKATITENADTHIHLLEDAQAITLSPLTNSSQERVVVRVPYVPQLSEYARAVYKKSSIVADWLKTGIQIAISSQQGYGEIILPVVSGEPAEYLIAGREKPLPADVTFENIPPVSAPDPLVTDNSEARGALRIAKEQRRTQSAMLSAIPNKDIIKNPTNKKILVVFVHGAGSESKPGYRWTRLKNFLLTRFIRDEEPRKLFEFWSFQYDSTKEIAENAFLLRDAIHEKFGARPYIVVAHSMGGLLAEVLYADEFSRRTFLGIITLGTPHHGSPFAIPKMYREMASRQAFPTLKYILYWGVSNNFASAIPSPTGKNNAVDPFTDFSPNVFTVGHRCLAFDGFDGEIPTRTYTLPFIVGEEAQQLTETLSRDDRLCVPCQDSKLYTYPGLTDIPHTRTVPCYFNFAEGLAKLKEYTGSAMWPHAFRYAGYFQELVDARYEKILLFDMAVKNLNGVLHNRSETGEQQALRYAAMDMFSLSSITQGIQSPFNATDGLVHVASALAQAGNVSVVDAQSTLARLMLNEGIIEQQKPLDTIAYRLFPDYSHLDIVIGKSSDDARLFIQIGTDMLWFKDMYARELSYSLTWGEINNLIQKTEKAVLLGENSDEQLSDGIRTRRAIVTHSQAVPSATEPNYATVTLKVEKNDGTRYSEGAWTETRNATFGRINGVWYWIALE
jgi:pimeloyl-ACP methyl ester carboxylesterase